MPLTLTEIQRNEKTAIGILADISPTILHIFNIPQPIQMTGQSLLKILNLPTDESIDHNKNKE